MDGWISWRGVMTLCVSGTNPIVPVDAYIGGLVGVSESRCEGISQNRYHWTMWI